MRILVCTLLVLSLWGCVPIGVRVQNLYAAHTARLGS